jgi:N-acetylneuraminic acid mutarotase
MRLLAIGLLLLAGCDEGLSPDFDLSYTPWNGDGGASWVQRRPLPAPQQETAVVALDGKIYVIGGFDRASQVIATVVVYDPKTDEWKSGTNLPEPLHHCNAAVVKGKIYVAGALRGGTFEAVGSVYVWDPASPASWTPKTSMPAGTERGASMTGAIGDRIYVAGGFRRGAVADFTAYDTVNDTWTPLPVLPAPRDHGTGAVVAGRLYAIGGRNATLQSINGRVDVFDPIVGSWMPRRAMLTPRAGTASGVVGSRIVVAGGEGNPASPRGVFPQVEVYDTAGDAWSAIEPMRTPRHGLGGAVVGNTFYLPGGGDQQQFGASAVFESIDL